MRCRRYHWIGTIFDHLCCVLLNNGYSNTRANMGAQNNISFTLQANNVQLKALFRKKDDVSASLRQIGYSSQACHSLAIYDALRFYTSSMKKTIPTKTGPVSKLDKRAMPVVKIHLNMSSDQLSDFKECLTEIRSYLKGQLDPEGDETFQMLSVVFDHVLAQKSKFQQFVNPGHDKGKPVQGRCVVCDDKAEIIYCGTSTCLKCKFFFQDLMRQRILLSLRCTKSGQCMSKEVNDISCKKCRYDRCRTANMVEQYCYNELPDLIVRSCVVCRKSEQTNRVVHGYSLCLDCSQGFHNLVESQLSDLVCLNDPECRCATYECRKCFMSKLSDLGLYRLHRLQNRKGSSDSCCVCAQDPKHCSDPWMDLIVCLECRTFLKVTLDNSRQMLYCCPRGEVGNICPVNELRCAYCWFLRCEIEGLVERWQICNGNVTSWGDILKSIEAESEDDEVE